LKKEGRKFPGKCVKVPSLSVSSPLLVWFSLVYSIESERKRSEIPKRRGRLAGARAKKSRK